MIVKSILAAEAEAREFIRRVEAWKAAHPQEAQEVGREWSLLGNRHTGAIHRGSLDLSAALVDLRQNRLPGK